MPSSNGPEDVATSLFDGVHAPESVLRRNNIPVPVVLTASS
jgi:hypothetical protein